MRCLIIEDEADTARYISNGLREAGFTVTWCRDGVNGLHLAGSERWDVVIILASLPGTGGDAYHAPRVCLGLSF